MRQTTKEKFPFIASSSGSGDDSEGESNTDSGSGSDAESSNDGGRFIDDQPAWKWGWDCKTSGSYHEYFWLSSI